MSSVEFNVLEGVWWVGLAMVALVAAWYAPRWYRRWAAVTAAGLLAFGISDFVQARYGSFFLPGLEWLLYWKAINLVVLCGTGVWYVLLRLQQPTTGLRTRDDK